MRSSPLPVGATISVLSFPESTEVTLTTMAQVQDLWGHLTSEGISVVPLRELPHPVACGEVARVHAQGLQAETADSVADRVGRAGSDSGAALPSAENLRIRRANQGDLDSSPSR